MIFTINTRTIDDNMLPEHCLFRKHTVPKNKKSYQYTFYDVPITAKNVISPIHPVSLLSSLIKIMLKNTMMYESHIVLRSLILKQWNNALSMLKKSTRGVYGKVTMVEDGYELRLIVVMFYRLLHRHIVHEWIE